MNLEEPNPKSTKSFDVDSHNLTPRARLWIIVSLYAFGGFLCALGMASGPSGGLLGIGLFFLAFGSLQSVCIWSVFGTDQYLFRLLISHGLFLFIGLCWVLAIILPELEKGEVVEEIIPFFLVTIPFVLPILFAGQIPLWCARLFCGWQFLMPDSKPERGFTIRDIFVFTMVVATMITAFNLSMYFAVQHTPVYESTLDSQAVKQSTQHIREAQRLMQNGYRLNGLIACGIAGVCSSLVGLPMVYFVFRSKNDGCRSAFFLSLGITSFLVVVATIISPGFAVPSVIIIPMVVTGCTLTSYLPLAVLKSAGVSLHSNRTVAGIVVGEDVTIPDVVSKDKDEDSGAPWSE